MKNKLFRTLYYVKRCGLGYIIDAYRGKGRSDETNRKLYDYFIHLDKSQYKAELQEYLSVFVENGENYDLDNPKTFNEKIQWLKLHDSSAIKSKLADKYAVRAWVAEKIGEEYLIPLVGGPWKSGSEIDFDSLPMQFALKGNHGSAMNLIVKDKKKIDYKKATQIADRWMNTLYGWNGMEIHYFDIPRRIIAEKYIEQSDGNLVDYKFHCFNGTPYVLQLMGDRDMNTHKYRMIFLDMDWNKRDVRDYSHEQYEIIPPKPDQYEKMLEIVEKLAAGFKYVRVDLYIIKDQIYFGEMTFTPANGTTTFDNAFEIELGALIDIKEISKKE